MKYFILGLFLSFTALASEVETQLEKRSENYSTLRQYYSKLLANINIQNDKIFCINVLMGEATLIQIFEDDQLLLKALKSSSDDDFLNYAKHIEDNSLTPLFSSYAYQELCDAQNTQSILKLTQSLQYHVMNVDYLAMSNLLFWQSISNSTH